MIRDIFTVLRGSVVAQAIGFLLLPVISRLFGPEAFGHFTVYQSAILILGVVVCGRYDFAIISAEDAGEARKLASLSLLLAVAVAVVLAFLVAILEAADLARRIIDLPFSLFVLPFAALAAASALVSTALLTRLGQFPASARSRMIQALVTAGLPAGLGWFSAAAIVLVMGDIAGKAMAAFYGLGRKFRLDRHGLGKVARKYRSYPTYSVLGGLLNNGGTAITPIMMYSTYSAGVSGQFALVDRAISLPLGVVVIAVSQVFAAHFGAALREQPLAAREQLTKIVRNLTLLGLAPMAIGIFTAPLLFDLVFGEQWARAGHFAQLLAPMYLSSLVVGPLSMALLVLGGVRTQLGWEAGRLVLLVALWLTVRIASLPPESAMLLFCGVNILVNVVFVGLTYRLLDQRIAAIASPSKPKD